MKNTFILFAYSTNILVRLLFINMKNSYFTIPRFNTVSFGKHSLRYMGPKVWSSVPSNVKKGVWKSGNPESGIGTGIGTGTGTGTGIGTGMGRETYIKAGTTFTLI